MEIVINAILTIVGLVMLCFGGNWLVNGGVIIAKKLGVSKMVIGMTVVAYGTSTPELAASIAASGVHTDLILGNVVGSNISNIGMVIGISAIMVPLVVSRLTVRKEVPIMIGVSFLLIALSIDGEVSQYDGILLMGALIIFTVLMYKDVKKQRQENFVDKQQTNQQLQQEKQTKKNVYLHAFGLIAVGVGLLLGGAILTVDNAVIVAKFFGLTERVIGIVIVAIGTSLPELITSVIAIRKGHTDIGIGNIIGSNIYNILMIMGVASAIAGIGVTPEVYTDYLVMIAFSLVMLIVMRTGRVGKKIGMGLVATYFIYLVATLLLT